MSILFAVTPKGEPYFLDTHIPGYLTLKWGTNGVANGWRGKMQRSRALLQWKGGLCLSVSTSKELQGFFSCGFLSKKGTRTNLRENLCMCVYTVARCTCTVDGRQRDLPFLQSCTEHMLWPCDGLPEAGPCKKPHGPLQVRLA